MSARFKLLPGRWANKYGPKTQSSKFGGSIGSDVVQIGTKKLDDLPFGLVDEPAPNFWNQPFDGILGLSMCMPKSPRGNNCKFDSVSIVQRLWQSKQIDEPIITVYLKKQGKYLGIRAGSCFPNPTLTLTLVLVEEMKLKDAIVALDGCGLLSDLKAQLLDKISEEDLKALSEEETYDQLSPETARLVTKELRRRAFP
ncbi:hypothetical protein AAVH_22654 [Aphelenchoides avenae]|nr:hypothetical protein AAVH_22654 [Aphelenchus avenae]